MSASVVYRVFDSADQLLYVGVTRDPIQRFTFHEYQTPWWCYAHRVEVSQEFEDRQAAEDAEALAITTLKPALNRRYPYVPEGAPIAEFEPYEYTNQPNLPAVMRQIAGGSL